jgi:prepilin-type N-terminal cleavage/methylation domain-containing protein
MKKGFTIVELMVSIGILTILFAFTTINVTRLPSSAAQSASHDRLINDIRGQQTKAMTSFDPALTPVGGKSYGIHFETTSYTIFTGTNYSPSDLSNFVIELDPNVTITNVSFPNSQVVFTPGTGDVTGYINGSDSISTTNSATGEVKILRINKYGATY